VSEPHIPERVRSLSDEKLQIMLDNVRAEVGRWRSEEKREGFIRMLEAEQARRKKAS